MNENSTVMMPTIAPTATTLANSGQPHALNASLKAPLTEEVGVLHHPGQHRGASR